MKRLSISTLGFLICFVSTISCAKDLGVRGQVYPITEPDLINVIQSRLQVMQQSGLFKALQSRWQHTLERTLNQPLAVPGITKAQQKRIWTYDPTIIIPYDLQDDEGRTLVARSTLFNPLTRINLQRTLIFYDARDIEQVNWVKQLDRMLAGKDKLILVGGTLTEQMHVFQKPVYFDQGGYLTRRLGIQHVPALVVQRGLQLQVSEVRPCV